MRDIISEHAGAPYRGRWENEEDRDRFSAEMDWAASKLDDTPAGEPLTVREPVFTIMGSGEHRGGSYQKDAEEWRWGIGTNLRVSRSSIPALLRVLSDLMEYDPDAALRAEYEAANPS